MAQPDLAQLMAALPHVLAAPRDTAGVRGLCVRPGIGLREFPDQITLSREQAVLGDGDRWRQMPWLRRPDGAPDPDIQVSILPARVLDLVWRPGDDAPHPGDTIVADLNCTLDNLPPGSRIAAGSAVLRVSALFNDGCVKWKARYGADAKAWIVAPGHPELRLRGILCAVEQDGVLTRQDCLRVLSRGSHPG